MRRIFRLFLLVVMFYGYAEAAIIPVDEVTVSSWAGGQYYPENLINGSGLTAEGLHDGRYWNMWLTDNYDLGTVIFDFGSLHTITSVDIWQYNYTYNSCELRGVKEFALIASVDGDYWETVAFGVLAMSPGGPIAAENFQLNTAARYVAIYVLSNYGDIKTGLSEVRFYDTPLTTPIPGAAWLLGPAMLGIALVRKRCKSLLSGETFSNGDPPPV